MYRYAQKKDTTLDTEITHIPEALSYLAFEGGGLLQANSVA